MPLPIALGLMAWFAFMSICTGFFLSVIFDTVEAAEEVI